MDNGKPVKGDCKLAAEPWLQKQQHRKVSNSGQEELMLHHNKEDAGQIPTGTNTDICLDQK